MLDDEDEGVMRTAWYACVAFRMIIANGWPKSWRRVLELGTRTLSLA